MLVSLIKNKKIYKTILPKQVTGNYWVQDTDKNNIIRNLINIVAKDGNWVINSNYEASIMNGEIIVENFILKNYSFCGVKIKNEDDAILYCSPVYDDKTTFLKVKIDCDINIGNDPKSEIFYNYKSTESKFSKLYYRSGNWTVEALSNMVGTYVNDIRVKSKKLKYGDVVFIVGLKIIILKDHIIINNPLEDLKVSFLCFELSELEKQKIDNNFDIDSDEVKEDEKVTFFRAPRFKTSIETLKMNIDSAPAKEKVDDTPMIYVIGPMITMALTSIVSAMSTVNTVITQGESISKATPSLIMSGTMVVSMLLWPLLNRKYEKKKKLKAEGERQKKYSKYIEEKRNLIKSTMKVQQQILIENNLPFEDLRNIILLKKSNLWERQLEHDDFLRLRLGIGTVPLDLEINYSEEHFEMEEDNLKDILSKLANDSKDLHDVPIVVSFAEKHISAVIGTINRAQKFVDGLILQMITYHGYDDLKIVVFTDEDKKSHWEYMKSLPHCWNEDRTVRFFATNSDEMKEVSAYLYPQFESRKFGTDQNNDEKFYSQNKPYYIFIVDNFLISREIEIIKSILEEKKNIGFSIIVINNKLSSLPKECMNFICISNNDNEKSGLFENELTSEKQKEFIPDINMGLDISDCCRILANINLESDTEIIMPNMVTFLEMFDIGNIEQLNSLVRWKQNNPTQSLQTPVGVDKFGQLFKLDLHEKFHGPHGLIAGMTGSGKSEFIITFILSLAVNYHPNEVSFVLIDYKGGGLAGAFENKETGFRLPHVIGTITNLDIIEMNRSLASIQSELKRRQRIFNEARDKTNESTINIYKYQKLYREGVVTEPIPHLLIISDEFAELKSQQPEFMDQLNSTARIGRSLGVHLILATQKPSGVVDDQIWSNSRFKVCLKVQESADSMDMIKNPDAASLKQTGRFYLQVGYNEFYAMGQSAWCGAKYKPTDKFKKKVDESLEFIDNVGYDYKKIEEESKIINSEENYGEELKNIVEYIIKLAKSENIETKKLWLDRIPDIIYNDDLEKKYSYQPKPREINPLIGEYDDPSTQTQSLLTYNITKNGNGLIYGVAGSGKSVLISNIIYSSMIKHPVDEVNFYILDFGSEVLRIFSESPHVGDIVVVGEDEKIHNFFKMLFTILEDRKNLLIEYNGDFNFYNEKSPKPLPLIIVIINNYDSFIENYEDSEELLIQLSREGSKYGIKFVISANGTSSIRYKLSQNFSNNFVLQLNDETDYSSVLGRTNGMVPSKSVGRGLINLGAIYEFQSSYPYKPDEMSEYIKNVCKDLKEKFSDRAPKIPILPDIVLPETTNKEEYKLDAVPLGIEKVRLEIAKYNFIDNYSTLISSLENETLAYNIPNVIKQISNINNVYTIILDALELLPKENLPTSSNIKYYNSNYNDLIKELLTNIEKRIEELNSNPESANNSNIVCVLIGIQEILNTLDDETKQSYETLLEKGKTIKNIYFIFVDTNDVLQSLQYENWYKPNINNAYGIWYGNGLSEQSTISLTKSLREYEEEIGNNFGWIINRGTGILFKALEEKKVK